MQKLNHLQKNKIKAGIGFGIVLAITSLINAVGAFVPLIVDLTKPKLERPPIPVPMPKPLNQSRYEQSSSSRITTIIS